MHASKSGKELRALSLSFVASLKACAKNKDLYEGTRIHTHIRQSRLLEKNIYLGNAIVSMYAKCGAIAKAQEVLRKLPVRDVVTWSALIAGYVQMGQGKEALQCYEGMVADGQSPNGITYASILKACALIGALDKGAKLHEEIVCQGLLGKDVMLGNALVDMYAKCGQLIKAWRVLDGLLVKDVVSWNALIVGHVKRGQGKEALHCYKKMQSVDVSPDAITYACILKSCGITQDIKRGQKFHDEIIEQGILAQDYVKLGTALVDMYAKCGELTKARQVLDELPFRDVVSWSALIAGYSQKGKIQESLDCFYQLLSEGLSPDTFTYVCILNAFAIEKDLDKGKQIHDEIINRGLLSRDVILGNALIDLYVKCDVLTQAQQVLEHLPVRDIGSWSALIAGYSHQGQVKEALNCYDRLRNEGISPNATIYSSILKACGITGVIAKGKQIHDEIISEGLLGKDVVLDNALIDMYVQCGDIPKAEQVLDELPVQDIVSWNVLIAGHVQKRQGKEALGSILMIRSKGLSPDAITYTNLLKACGITKELDKGQQLHDEIVSSGQGLLRDNVVLGTALVDMYIKCGAISKAQELLDELPIRDVNSWTALIAGYTQQGKGQEALDYYQRMWSEGLSPNVDTYASALKACGLTRDVGKGEQIHHEIAGQALFGKDVVLGNALVDMYAKCGALTKAREVLDELPVRNVVSWSALIAGYVQMGQGKEAMDCYQGMQSEGLFPDAFTYAGILTACCIMRDVDKGKQIHHDIVSQGLLAKDVVLGNALVNMYAKCGMLTKAQEVLEELPIQNSTSWNVLITGYTEHGQGEEALVCFQRMRSKGLFPDVITYSCILKACGIAQDSDMGILIHDEIVTHAGLLDDSIPLQTALVDMYAKCGLVAKAHEVLAQLPLRNVVSWSALMAGYAYQGRGKEALECLHRMQEEGLTPDVVSWNALIGGYAQEGEAEGAMGCFDLMQQARISPDAVTFLCVLNACSHSGLVGEGQLYYESMTVKYGVSPNIEHQSCMIDLFARTGHFDEAMALIKKMPSGNHAPLWSSLLEACNKWGNAKVGMFAFKHAAGGDDGGSLIATIYRKH